MSGYMWALHKFLGSVMMGNNAAAEDFMMAPVGVPTVCVGADGFMLVKGASARMVCAEHPVLKTVKWGCVRGICVCVCVTEFCKQVLFTMLNSETHTLCHLRILLRFAMRCRCSSSLSVDPPIVFFAVAFLRCASTGVGHIKPGWSQQNP